MRSGVRRRAVLGAVVAVASLAGCVSIPTSGPVREGDVPERELAAPLSLPVEPIPDGTPEEIVQGFLRAGAAGLSDDFRAARTHLTSGASWEPQEQVLVYGAPGPQLREDAGTVVVTVPVAAIVDRAGIYTEVAAPTPQHLEYEMVQDSTNQWRISSAPDGVVMSPRDFEQLYRDVPVYFASPDLTHLVPDLRHFPARDEIMPTKAVDALLDGPALWLRGAVRSSVPEGAQLTVSAVTVTGTVATVDLTEPANLAEVDRNLLQVQLEATLQNLPTTITEVSVTVGGLPWVNQRGELDEMTIDPAPAEGPYVLVDDGFALVEQGELIPLTDVASLAGLSPNNPAFSPDGEVRVLRSGRSRLMLLPAEGGDPVELHSASALIPPSVDRFGWVWTGSEASGGTLLGVTPDGDKAEIAAEWLEGSKIQSIRVARDGTRIAVVSTDGDGRVSVDVAGVVRDEESQRPLRLGERWQIGAPLTTASEVEWTDEVTVAVLGIIGDGGSAGMHLVPLGGPTTALSIVENTMGIATGRGPREQYVVDIGGRLWLRKGSVWSEEATGVSAALFPG